MVRYFLCRVYMCRNDMLTALISKIYEPFFFCICANFSAYLCAVEIVMRLYDI